MNPTFDVLEESLWKDVLDPWFPAGLSDRGFHQNFSEDWTRLPGESRGVVFQARMTWLCATVFELDSPRSRPFGDYARHGADFIVSNLIGPSGEVLFDTEGGDEIHAYGAAFAIYGLAAAARTLQRERYLEVAQSAFRWLEKYLYDGISGGYFECGNLAGAPKLEGSKPLDIIGNPYGQKSQNTQLHLLEAYTELYRIWPDAILRARLEELLKLFTHKFYVEPGWLHTFVLPDWTPVPNNLSFGHDVEATHLLHAAMEVLGEWTDDNLRKARSLVDYALDFGWDAENGGFFYEGPAGQPATVRARVWWVAAEGLLALAQLWKMTGNPKYQEALAGQWKWIVEHQIDHEHHGWHERISPEGVVDLTDKGQPWKAAYHDGRAMMFAAKLLK